MSDRENNLSVRNPDGIWVNTSLFSTEAKHFKKYGYYCPDPWGSPAWEDYWREQLDYCINGYSVGGVKILGHHYYYLNFKEILLVEYGTTGKVTKKIKDFPYFWDGDYNYFWAKEIARNGIIPKELKKLNLHITIPEKYLDGGYHFLVAKARRKGYQQPYSETIITPSGLSTMGEIRVGDFISTPNGKAKVLEKYEQGECDVYEMTLQDGRKVKCGKEHLWKIIEFRGTEKIVNTEFFLDKKLKRGTKGKEYHGYFLPQNEEVIFDKQKDTLPIHPYLLGLLIGDGSVNNSTCLFSTVDTELLSYIEDILGDDYDITKTNLEGCQYRITYNKKSNVNPILTELKNLGLRTIAKNKVIPDIYKYSSVENRYELVRGLMDTDGSAWRQGSCNFVSTSEQLIEDLMFILRSLGIRVKKTKNNNVGKGFSKSQVWTLIITTDKQIFKLKRKAILIKKREYNINKIAIVKVEKLDYKEKSACILIGSEEHLYLTKDFIVTHNSYKNAAVVENTYNTIPNSLCLIGAFDKKYLYPEGTMGMVSKGLDFLNQYTGWAKGREFLNRVDHKRASYSQTDARGFTYETGYMSQVMALTFKDNPDAARGKDAVEVLLEEAGKFSNLQASFMATDDTLRAGKYLTGQMTIFGTSGDIEGDSLDLANMFYNPEPFRILPFVNIWDDNAENSLCCFFHPVHWNMEGCMDEHGNSDLEAALSLEMEHRDLMVKTAKSSVMLQQRQMENPTKPSEAFMNVSVNNFPVAELKEQLAKVKAQSLHTKTGVAGYFMYDNDGKLRFKPDLTASLQPLWDYPPKSKDLAGCVVVYEDYRVSEPGTYKIGYDPYRQNVSEYSDSVGSVYVYKTIIQGDPIRNIIAAEYVGRPQDMDTFNRNVEMLAEYYHAEVMYENEVTAVKTYFEKRKKLKYLAAQPDNLISTIIKDSRVNRIYGMHMTDKIKEAGEKYTNSWLLEERGVNEKGNVIRNLNMINSKGLLEELILYNRKGNFDRVMAWFMVMFQLEADSINPPEQRQQRMESIREDLEKLTKNLYRR